MTRYFMNAVTGTVYTEEELKEYEEQGERVCWRSFIEVRPVVDDPSEINVADWEEVD